MNTTKSIKQILKGKELSRDEIQGLRTNPPLLLSEAELAIVAGISPRSIRNYERRSLLPFIKIGRRKLYRKDAVFQALERLEFKSVV